MFQNVYSIVRDRESKHIFSNIKNNIVSIFENVCFLLLYPYTVVLFGDCSLLLKVSFPHSICLIFQADNYESEGTITERTESRSNFL